MTLKLEHLIEKLNLKPHPEGGYYKETYRSLGEINNNSLSESYSGKRNYSTCIYYLLTYGNFSSFHRIRQDEIWHFYYGSPIRLHTISESGNHKESIIGIDINSGQIPQLIVSGGDWFAAEVIQEGGYGLVGCTVSPGFSFDDFELANRHKLIEKFPEHKQLITNFTRI